MGGLLNLSSTPLFQGISQILLTRRLHKTRPPGHVDPTSRAQTIQSV
jgi:hypothetical protein